jgi:hypothetical protein
MLTTKGPAPWPTFELFNDVPPPHKQAGFTGTLRSMEVGQYFDHSNSSRAVATMANRLKPKKFTTHKQKDGVTYRTWRIE